MKLIKKQQQTNKKRTTHVVLKLRSLVKWDWSFACVFAVRLQKECFSGAKLCPLCAWKCSVTLPAMDKRPCCFCDASWAVCLYWSQCCAVLELVARCVGLSWVSLCCTFELDWLTWIQLLTCLHQNYFSFSSEHKLQFAGKCWQLLKSVGLNWGSAQEGLPRSVAVLTTAIVWMKQMACECSATQTWGWEYVKTT